MPSVIAAISHRRFAVGMVFFFSLFLPLTAARSDDSSNAIGTKTLPDVVLGRSDAPVTIIEYASMTCTHCAHFHATVYPTLDKDYIATGKVRFILREFPYDPLATAAFMLGRCSGDRRTAVLDMLFDMQPQWAFVAQPLEALSGLLKQTGMSKVSFDACLRDQTLYGAVQDVAEKADREMGVHATPTFIINGVKFDGEVNLQTLSKTLAPLIANKS